MRWFKRLIWLIVVFIFGYFLLDVEVRGRPIRFYVLELCHSRSYAELKSHIDSWIKTSPAARRNQTGERQVDDSVENIKANEQKKMNDIFKKNQ